MRKHAILLDECLWGIRESLERCGVFCITAPAGSPDCHLRQVATDESLPIVTSDKRLARRHRGRSVVLVGLQDRDGCRIPPHPRLVILGLLELDRSKKVRINLLEQTVTPA